MMNRKRRLLIVGMVAGALLTLSPLGGLLATVFGMTRSFATLGDAGIADPKALSDSIGSTLIFTAAGFVLFSLGILGFTLSLVFYLRLRASTPPPLPPQSGR